MAAAAAAAAALSRGLALSPSDLPAGWAATLLSSHPLAGATPPFPPKLVTWYQLHPQADVPSRVADWCFSERPSRAVCVCQRHL